MRQGHNNRKNTYGHILTQHVRNAGVRLVACFTRDQNNELQRKLRERKEMIVREFKILIMPTWCLSAAGGEKSEKAHTPKITWYFGQCGSRAPRFATSLTLFVSQRRFACVRRKTHKAMCVCILWEQKMNLTRREIYSDSANGWYGFLR